MSTDYREKEREFLDSLKDDTGRDVREWMAAISAQNLPHRNDIIDWLRQQGFMFSKASWLERVHHNGGKAIYSDAALPRRAMPKRLTPIAAVAASSEREAPVSNPTAEKPPIVSTVQAMPPPASELEAVLATAKAYRPLATYLLREIGKAVPSAVTAAAAAHVSLSCKAREFAVLAMGPRDLRLGLALEGHPFELPLQTARFPNPAVRAGAAITHMAILNDVRQVDSRLIAWIIKAAG